MAALRAIARERKPDVAIGFMHSVYLPLGLALIGTGIPLVASEHIVPAHYRSRLPERALLRLSPYLAVRITCVSEQVLRSFPKALQRKMIAVANPITVRTRGRADAVGASRDRKVVLAVGRLEPQKDHLTLIEAFAAVADSFPGWDLRIVGEGSLRLPLEASIVRLGLERRVQLPGAIKDIGTEYLNAQLFVTPSLYESFGLSTAEALAHGLPAIGFDDCQGVNELIRPGVNGLLVPGRGTRVSALAAALKSLMDDHALRARLVEPTPAVAERFHIERVLDEWERLLADAASDTRVLRNARLKLADRGSN
jgi:glycosyltransferase involved in cell wall biosynthesis